mgnify:CR=1 FL=1
MGELNGIDTARRLRKLGVEAPIIFLTASPDFALESYEVEASGYLLKPADEERRTLFCSAFCEQTSQADCGEMQAAVPISIYR